MAKSPLRRRLDKEYAALLKTSAPGKVKDAMTAYRTLASDLKKLPVAGNDLMAGNKSRLITRIFPAHIGRLCMFYYNPKLRKTLPYYDRFPMIMPIEIYNDGFLGINFHYLPHRQRALLMDAINDNVLKNQHLTDKKRLFISYRIMKATVRSPAFIPCIKRYLYTQLSSRIYLIEPDAWNIALFLPLERFEKASMGRVHQESMRKIRNYGAF